MRVAGSSLLATRYFRSLTLVATADFQLGPTSEKRISVEDISKENKNYTMESNEKFFVPNGLGVKVERSKMELQSLTGNAKYQDVRIFKGKTLGHLIPVKKITSHQKGLHFNRVLKTRKKIKLSVKAAQDGATC